MMIESIEQIVSDLVNYLLVVEIGLLVLLGLAALAWFAAEWYICRCQAQVKRQAPDIETAFASIRQEVTALTQAAADYPPADPPPYRILAEDLHRQLDTVQEQLARQSEQFKRLSTAAFSYPDHLLTRFWTGLVTAPHFWQQQRRNFAALAQTVESLQAKVKDTAPYLTALHHLPLAVAEDARALQQAIGQTLQIRRALHDMGLHGYTFDSATAYVQQLSTTLEQPPAYFLYGSDDQILAQASKTDVVVTWNRVQQLESPVQVYLEKFQLWQTWFREISQGMQNLEQAVRLAAVGLSGLPAPIDAGELVAEFEQAQKNYQLLDETYPALTVELLPDFAQRLAQTTATVVRLTRRCETITQQFRALSQTIQANSILLPQLGTQMKTLARAEKYPLRWGEYGAELASLDKTAAQIGPVDTPRTPARFEQDLQTARKLATTVQTLAGQVETVQVQRQELISLLEKPALNPEPAWFKQAQTLQQETRPYAASNWSGQDSVSKLKSEAKKLANRRRQWVPRSNREAIWAPRLGHQLQQVQQLVTELESFQKRLDRVAEMLAQVQAEQQAADQELETVRYLVGELLRQLQAAHPPFDSNSVVVKQQRKLEKLLKRSRKLAANLDDSRRAGPMAGIAGEVHGWTETCHREIHALAATLEDAVGQASARPDGQTKARPTERTRQEVKQHLAAQRPAELPPLDETGDSPAAEILREVQEILVLLQEREK